MGYHVNMSRKTENIYQSLDKLKGLEERLSYLNKTIKSRELDDLDFEFSQEIKNLRFWIDSLYLYNGKSTSNAKKTASRENGKKGGRPPKQITQMKRRRLEIEELIPELEHKIKFAENLEEENKLKKQIEELKKENQEISSALEQYTKGSLKSES